MEDLLMKFKVYFTNEKIFVYEKLGKILDNQDEIDSDVKMIDLDTTAELIFGEKYTEPKSCDGLEIFKDGILLVEAKGFTKLIEYHMINKSEKKCKKIVDSFLDEKFNEMIKKVIDSLLILQLISHRQTGISNLKEIGYNIGIIPKMIVLFFDISDNIGPISTTLINFQSGNLIEYIESEIKRRHESGVLEQQIGKNLKFRIMYRRDLNKLEDIIEEDILGIEEKVFQVN